MNKILNLLNLKIDNNQKYILLSLFISGLLLTYVSPMFTKVIITALPAEWIAFESLFASISTLIIGILWKGKPRETAMKHFIVFCLIETIASFTLAIYLLLVEFNVWVYAIFSLFYVSFITIFVGKCIMAFKTKLWNEEKRELYDNNTSIISGITCISGFLLALLFMPSLELSLILWAIACIVDDIGWMIVYIKNKEVLCGQ